MTYDNLEVINNPVKNETEKLMINGERLTELLDEVDMSISEFAVLKARVHPQTVYNAIKGEGLKPKSFRRLTRAIGVLEDGSIKSKSTA